MRVDVIIPTYNSAHFLEACLQGTRQALAFAATHRALEYTIWIVDNHSQDATCEKAATQGPRVHLLCLPHNEGFARAVNRAAALGTGHVWLLNPDTVPERDSLVRLLTWLDIPRVAAVGPALIHPHGRVAAESARRAPSLLRESLDKLGLTREGRLSWLGYGLGHLTVAQDVPVLSGAALLVRRQAWESVRGLDESFWMYGEDTDLCVRLRKGGWQCIYEPRARVRHVGGGSGSPQTRLMLGMHAFYSMAYFFTKHHGPRTARAYRYLMGILALLKWGYWWFRRAPYHREVQRYILDWAWRNECRFPHPGDSSYNRRGGDVA